MAKPKSLPESIPGIRRFLAFLAPYLGQYRLPITGSFAANPPVVDAGQPVTLSWSVRNAESCTPLDGAGGWTGKVIDPAGGSTDVIVSAAGSYTFRLQCTGGGSMDTASVIVTVTEPVPGIPINAGLTDSWFYPATAGQGFFIIVWEELQTMFLAWFTYDVERPPGDVTAILGEPGHRWITAQGPYSGDTATLEINVTSGGIFDSNEPPVDTVAVGTMTVRFTTCNEGLISYQFDSLGLSGAVPIERIVLDRIPLCEALTP